MENKPPLGIVFQGWCRKLKEIQYRKHLVEGIGTGGDARKINVGCKVKLPVAIVGR